MSRVAQRIAGVLVIAMGMVGLFCKVEYSGWVLFVGCLVVLP